MNDTAIDIATNEQALVILTLDLGTTCGWAVRNVNGVIKSGSASFARGKHDTAGQRWLKFQAHLSSIKRDVGEIHAIYYEDVKRHIGTQAAHAYGAFEAMLQVFCDLNRIRLYGVGVGVIKKAWTGKGNAKKEAMIAAARERGFRPRDDNEADALAILHFAIAREIL